MLQNVRERTAITEPHDVAEIVTAILNAESETDQDKEHFWVLGLNTRHVIKYVDLVSLGCMDQSICHPRETFRLAVLKGAHAIILVHNHPSGDPASSLDDREVTRRMVEAGKVLGIDVLDHVIVANGSERYTSLRSEGVVK